MMKQKETKKSSRYYVIKCYGGAQVVDPGKKVSQTWISGKKFGSAVPNPLKCEIIAEGSMVNLFIGNICLMSDHMLEVLKQAGVNNIDIYPAVIHRSDTDQTWTNYKAVNIIGLVACADWKKSKTDKKGMTDVAFDSIGIDEKKADASGLLIFRLAEAVGTIIVHQKLKTALEKAGFSDLTFMPPEEAVI